MPIYEYTCPKCGRFEVVQKVSDKPVKCKPDCTDKACPRKAQREISAAAFHLKGGGWYKTDYAGKSSGNTPAGNTPAEGSSSSDKGTASSSEEGASAKKEKGALKKRGGGGCGSGCSCH